MQDKISISVIIPTFNRANELIGSIKSVLNQTYPVLEILICDDGSTDDSEKLISALNVPIVKWIGCGKNGGPAIPRNIGINKSLGNWVAFLDSDDEWMPDKIQKQIDTIYKHNANAVCSNASHIRSGIDKGLYCKYNKHIITLSDLMRENSIVCSSVLINKQLLLSTSLFPEDKRFVAEDYVLWLRMATKTDFLFINEPLVRYFDNVETSYRSTYSHLDVWNMFDVVFTDFKQWIKQHDIHLSYSQNNELNLLMKKIARKGIPTAWEDFVRKFKEKIGIKNINK